MTDPQFDKLCKLIESLTIAIDTLAVSNQELIDTFMEEKNEDGGSEQIGQYLDGKPIKNIDA
jgi:hypothetical protein